ncbi:MAG: phenylalanine--tRNA ligase subunit alpha [Patescibacteria group bacterium]
MKAELLKIKQEITDAIKNVKDSGTLEELKNKYLSRKNGKLTILLKGLKDLTLDQKKEIGQFANTVKKDVSLIIETAKQNIENHSTNQSQDFDVSLPGKKINTGTIHPLTQIRLEVEKVFKSMGFKVYEGEELVSDFYNFESLNIPSDHPARDMQDTFFIKDHPDKVMRTHTSAMQVKIMENNKPPLKVIVPGRVFRNEATDASHEHTFHQVEGFVVGENISIANLVWTQKKLLSAIFGKEVKVRLRPGYFPFVEPGFELDCSCLICGGNGCPVCKQSGWVELIPCGMIHPKVFESAGYPKGKYSGFAFGMGWSRLAMMKYGIDDIRLFMSGDLKFLKQF